MSRDPDAAVAVGVRVRRRELIKTDSRIDLISISEGMKAELGPLGLWKPSQFGVWVIDITSF